MILYIISIVSVLIVISLYFYVESFKPVIESNGKYWFIRTHNKYVDFKFLQSVGPKQPLLLWSNPDTPCRFSSYYEASKYLKHVTNYVAEGKFYSYPTIVWK